MPELPEVERAVKAIAEKAVGKKIIKVDTAEDTIVFSGGSSHTEFADEVLDREVTGISRYGKVFYLELGGKGRMPVLHFGMTGNIHIKGSQPLQYKEGPKKATVDWPPRFMKFILHLSADGETTDAQIAFIDPRRLARIRLCQSPMKEPPISTLGFDPILCMPPLEEFSRLMIKRTCPVKALLLDQTFSAGVGNWVADEILYHARVHPEQRCNTLSSEQVSALFENMTYVCKTAVSVNADHTQFPDNWLFIHRWGKGKRSKNASPLKLPSGESATIKWITVGGRTSAYVVELQRVARTPNSTKDKADAVIDEESTSVTIEETVEVIETTRRQSKRLKEPADEPKARPPTKRRKTKR